MSSCATPPGRARAAETESSANIARVAGVGRGDEAAVVDSPGSGHPHSGERAVDAGEDAVDAGDQVLEKVPGAFVYHPYRYFGVA